MDGSGKLCIEFRLNPAVKHRRAEGCSCTLRTSQANQRGSCPSLVPIQCNKLARNDDIPTVAVAVAVAGLPCLGLFDTIETTYEMSTEPLTRL